MSSYSMMFDPTWKQIVDNGASIIVKDALYDVSEFGHTDMTRATTGPCNMAGLDGIRASTHPRLFPFPPPTRRYYYGYYDNYNKGWHPSIGVIIAIVVGGVALLAGVLVGILTLRRRCRRAPERFVIEEAEGDDMQVTPFTAAPIVPAAPIAPAAPITPMTPMTTTAPIAALSTSDGTSSVLSDGPQTAAQAKGREAFQSRAASLSSYAQSTSQGASSGGYSKAALSGTSGASGSSASAGPSAMTSSSSTQPLVSRNSVPDPIIAAPPGVVSHEADLGRLDTVLPPMYDPAWREQ